MVSDNKLAAGDLLAALDAYLTLSADERRQQRRSLSKCEDQASKRLLAAIEAADAETTDFDASTALPSTPEVDPYRVGEQCGPYQLTAKLGAGGMADVYSAEREINGVKQRVALKIFRQAAHGGDERRARFSREQRILAALEHPRVARLIEIGVDQQGRPFIAMEYVPGQPLQTFFSANKLDVRQKRRLLKDLFEVVAYAHGRFVIHRDIKPGNIIVGEDKRPHLIDFGIAKITGGLLLNNDTLEQTRALPFTVSYAAPEQMRGDELTPACDIYQLGLIAYFVLFEAHYHAFDNNTLPEIIKQLGERPYTPPDADSYRRHGLSAYRRALNNVLAKALSPRPSARYQSVDQFSDDLERVFEFVPTRAEKTHRWRRLSLFVQRYRQALTVTAVALAALAVFLTLYLRQLDHQQQATAARLQTLQVMQDILFQGHPFDPSRGQKSVADAIVDGSEALLQRPLPAALKAELLANMAYGLNHLGRMDDALALTEHALTLKADNGLPIDDKDLCSLATYAAMSESHAALLDHALAPIRVLPAGALTPSIVCRAYFTAVSLSETGQEAEALTLIRSLRQPHITPLLSDPALPTDLRYSVENTYAIVLRRVEGPRAALPVWEALAASLDPNTENPEFAVQYAAIQSNYAMTLGRSGELAQSQAIADELLTWLDSKSTVPNNERGFLQYLRAAIHYRLGHHDTAYEAVQSSFDTMLVLNLPVPAVRNIDYLIQSAIDVGAYQQAFQALEWAYQAMRSGQVSRDQWLADVRIGAAYLLFELGEDQAALAMWRLGAEQGGYGSLGASIWPAVYSVTSGSSLSEPARWREGLGGCHEAIVDQILNLAPHSEVSSTAACPVSFPVFERIIAFVDHLAGGRPDAAALATPPPTRTTVDLLTWFGVDQTVAQQALVARRQAFDQWFVAQYATSLPDTLWTLDQSLSDGPADEN